MILTFDCYGTLLNMGTIDETLREIGREGGVDGDLAVTTFVNYEDRLMYVDAIQPYEDLIRLNLEYVDMTVGAGHLFADHYWDVLQAYQALKPFPEVIAALQHLKDVGHSLYLMSNSSQALMQHHLVALQHVVDGTFTADMTGYYKPQLGFFNDVQKALNLDTQPHMHIAHGFWWDIVPCSQLHWNKIWVNRDHLTGLNRYQPYESYFDLTGVAQALG